MRRGSTTTAAQGETAVAPAHTVVAVPTTPTSPRSCRRAPPTAESRINTVTTADIAAPSRSPNHEVTCATTPRASSSAVAPSRAPRETRMLHRITESPSIARLAA